MKKLKLVCRDSKLSMVQAIMAQKNIQTIFPDYTIEIIGKKSKGDIEAKSNLALLEETDIFTQNIYNDLTNHNADIAVHSLKDLSSHHFFNSDSVFAVIDRDDPRDIAIFNSDIEDKIEKGEPIIIGTCSPRREKMATMFLQKALPQLHSSICISTKIIRGNVETRLQKLNTENYDGTILATAGLNRLLKSEHRNLIHTLLTNKKIMILPLIDCVPAPSQGAIVVEANINNKQAVAIIKAINNKLLFEEVSNEKKIGLQYGSGCSQKFGIATIKTKNKSYLYAAGCDQKGTAFNVWNNLPIPKENTKYLFSTTDYMKDFFRYEWSQSKTTILQNVIYIANYKAIKENNKKILYNEHNKQKHILVSGSKTWFELAKLGVWITASADGLGLEKLLEFIQMPLLNIHKDEICIITHQDAANRWTNKGFISDYTYTLLPQHNEALITEIKKANSIFWTSYMQYEQYKSYLKKEIKHYCLSGETANLLEQHKIKPTIFPTIKAFEQWRKQN